MDELLLKLIGNLGVPGLVSFFIYRLLDKYLGKFLEVHTRQAAALGDLAEAVKLSTVAQGDGINNVLTAVRVLAQKVNDCTDRMGERMGGGEILR